MENAGSLTDRSTSADTGGGLSGSREDDRQSRGPAAPSGSATASSSSSGAADSTARTGGSSDLAFGHTAVWPERLRVTVAEPRRFTPSEKAVTGDAKHHVVLSLTVHNRGDDEFSTKGMVLTATSGGVQADRIYDREHGLLLPEATVAPGKKTVLKAAFSVDDPEHLVLTVLPGPGYSAKTFTGGTD